MLSKVLGDYETVFQPVGLESQSNCGFCTDKMPTEILRCPYQTKHFIWTIRFRLDSGYIYLDFVITVGQKWQPNEAISAVTVHVCVCFTCG